MPAGPVAAGAAAAPRPSRHCPPAGMMQALPSAELARRPALLADLEPAPWLLPARTPALRYAGQHGFDQLLALRAGPAGRYRSAVTVLPFSRTWAAMAQNSGEGGGAGASTWPVLLQAALGVVLQKRQGDQRPAPARTGRPVESKEPLSRRAGAR